MTVVVVVMLRDYALIPRISRLGVLLTGVVGAYLVPPAVVFLSESWSSHDWLPSFSGITSGRFLLGAWVGFAVFFIGNTKANPRRVPLWAGVLTGVVAAVFIPPLLDRLTGTFQRVSLASDVNHCTRGMLGEVQPREVVNVCDEPISVGLCLPGESNPDPCAQTHTIGPRETARLDPRGEALSSLPSNPNGLTVVACPPPWRPSRMVTASGRGHEGVCLPPG